MNVKSKIFLALALVLSVTACSKGGGSHSSIPKTPGLIPELPNPTSDNTLMSYKGSETEWLKRNSEGSSWGVGSADNTYVAFNAPAGTFTSQMKDDKNKWDQNTQDMAMYKYIELGKGSNKFAGITEDTKLPEQLLYTSKHGNSAIGAIGNEIFIATRVVNPVHSTRSGTPTYSGQVIHTNAGKDPINLQAKIGIDFTPHGDYIGTLTKNSGFYLQDNQVAALQGNVLKSTVLNGIGQAFTKPQIYFSGATGQFEGLNSSALNMGFTDAGLTGLWGVYNNEAGDKGVFYVDEN
ncbi:hypothetical protein [Xenorhabdus bharatensis]|uniref:hypothetical protein n=1 Tax=Xenorhabdus bharatensis TaxID=3136256 RepID=UPI0030F3F867